MRRSNGYSLGEVVMVVAVLAVLGGIVTLKLVGTQSDAKTRDVLHQLDRQSTAVMQWASQQEEIQGGRRLGNLKLSTIAKAADGREVPEGQTPPGWTLGTGSSDTPPENSTMLYSDVYRDGERLRLTRCTDQYFDNGARFCARVDLYPWGNNKETANHVTYRLIECLGEYCAPPSTHSTPDCRRWPNLPPRDGNQPGNLPSCLAED